MRSPLKGLIEGILIPLRGIQIIMESFQIAKFALIPFVLGLIFLILGFFLASEYVQPLLHQWLGDIQFLKGSSILSSVFAGVLTFFYWILISLVNFFLGYLTIILLAGPFYALLAEQVFKKYWPEKKLSLSFASSLKMLLRGFMKVLVFILLGLVCFILSFIPFLNMASAALLFLMVSYDSFDYALEIDGKTLTQRWMFFRQYSAEMCGGALAVVMTSIIPGAFFLLLPAFICGATKLYIQRANPKV